jgi:hypothetical protein
MTLLDLSPADFRRFLTVLVDRRLLGSQCCLSTGLVANGIRLTKRCNALWSRSDVTRGLPDLGKSFTLLVSVSASCNRRPDEGLEAQKYSLFPKEHPTNCPVRWRLSNCLGVYLSWLQAGFSHHTRPRLMTLLDLSSADFRRFLTVLVDSRLLGSQCCLSTRLVANGIRLTKRCNALSSRSDVTRGLPDLVESFVHALNLGI